MHVWLREDADGCRGNDLMLLSVQRFVPDSTAGSNMCSGPDVAILRSNCSKSGKVRGKPFTVTVNGFPITLTSLFLA